MGDKRSSRKRHHDKAMRLSEAQNHRCCYCGIRTEKTDKRTDITPTIEHVWDRSNRWENLAMACYRCNHLKRAFCAIAFFELRLWRFKNPQQMRAYLQRIGFGG